MRWGWVLCGLLLVSCTVRANPRYCDEDADCNVGTICNLSSHGCVEAVDAAVSDELSIDAPHILTTVREVRDPSVPDETFVELSSVVVTAIDSYGSSTGEFWVQDEGGGTEAGVRVVGGVTMDVNSLVVGDVVAITNARKKRMVDLLVRQRLGQVLVITKLGTSMSPTIARMDVAAISALDSSQRVAELERWAGTLVRVEGVRAATAPDKLYQTFSIGVLEIDPQQSSLPAGIVADTCFASIVGVIVQRNAGVFELIPRSLEEIQIGSGCS